MKNRSVCIAVALVFNLAFSVLAARDARAGSDGVRADDLRHGAGLGPRP